ncbi:PorV/PorQ family protein, partial [candidate division WOR-3 bacterium]|nr:PorV/PorQ family protein [candidate division WOR-3 bacterium]
MTYLQMILSLGLTVWFGSTEVGTTALPILKAPVGPRASALGEAFVGLADDVTALYWNPAGLGRSGQLEYFVSHQEWFRGIRDEHVSVAMSAGKGRVGLGFAYSGVTGIEAWDEFNRRASDQTVADHTAIVCAGYGVPIVNWVHAGAGIKVAYDYMGAASTGGTGVGADLGVLIRPVPRLNVGLSARNMGAASYASRTGLLLLPASLRAGAGYSFRDLNLVADIALPIDNRPSLHVGTEYTMLNTITLRGGYRTGPHDLGTLGLTSGMCLGLGLSLGRFAVDYAFVPYGSLGSVHRIGIRSGTTGGGKGSLELAVIDGATGEPIPFVAELSGVREGRFETVRRQPFRIRGFRDGWVRIAAGSTGYQPTFDSVYVWGDRDQKARVALFRPGRGTIWGTFLDAETRKAIPGLVTYSGKTSGEVAVDEQGGAYCIKNLSGGSYILHAWSTREYRSQCCTLDVAPDKVVVRDFFLQRRNSP